MAVIIAAPGPSIIMLPNTNFLVLVGYVDVALLLPVGSIAAAGSTVLDHPPRPARTHLALAPARTHLALAPARTHLALAPARTHLALAPARTPAHRCRLLVVVSAAADTGHRLRRLRRPPDHHMVVAVDTDVEETTWQQRDRTILAD